MVCGLRRWRQLSDKAARRTYATDWRPQKKLIRLVFPSVLRDASSDIFAGRKTLLVRLIIARASGGIVKYIADSRPSEKPRQLAAETASLRGSHCGPRRSGRATHQFGASNSSGRASVTPKTITAAPMPSRAHAWTQRYLRLCGVALPLLLALHATNI